MFRGIYQHLIEELEGIYSRFVQNVKIAKLTFSTRRDAIGTTAWACAICHLFENLLPAASYSRRVSDLKVPNIIQMLDFTDHFVFKTKQMTSAPVLSLNITFFFPSSFSCGLLVIIIYILFILGGVYMISGRLSSRREFTPVPSYGSVFVYMIPTQNVMPARVIPARVHPGSCVGARFSSRHEN